MFTRHIHKRDRFVFLAIISLFLAFNSSTSLAQGTSFTYQGKLNDGGAPANGAYDLQFKLFDTATVGTGTQQGATVTPPTVTVTSGIFTVTLDFGACATCFNGSPRFLEIAVKAAAAGSFTTLTPRQPVTSNPYAIRSGTAATADTATNTTQLGGLPASGFIQNTTTPQPGTNLSIAGNGTVAGTLTGGIVNATTQYNIGGNRVISIGGTGNLFAGVNAGSANTTGANNAFAGFGAGSSNTTGSSNSFFGNGAGSQNTTGMFNSFVGDGAGGLNTTGSNNSFFGYVAGISNTSGFFNSFFGVGSGSGNTTGGANSFFGLSSGFSNTVGGNNSFFGDNSGSMNTVGLNNSFFGKDAGKNNTTGNSNSFVGVVAGVSNTIGSSNTFVGFAADAFTNNLTNATAIGANAKVSQSNSLILGNNASVGIGTFAPSAKLHVTGDGIVRARVNSDSNAGFGLALNEQLKWSVATTTGANFQIFNDAIAQHAVWIDGSNNNVGIGTTAPNHKLHVVGQDVRVEGDSPSIFPRFSLNFTGGASNEKHWQNYAAPGSLVFSALNDLDNAESVWLQVNRGPGTTISKVVVPSGNVGIGTTDPLAKLHVQGFVRLSVDTGGINQLCLNGFIISSCSSSIRYKRNINSFEKGLSLIKQLRPVSFNWRSNDQADFGLVAEEVNQVEPLLTTTNDKGEIEGVKYDRVGVVLVNAVLEQQREIESLAKRIDLQNRLINKQREESEKQQIAIKALKLLVCSQNPTAEFCMSKE